MNLSQVFQWPFVKQVLEAADKQNYKRGQNLELSAEQTLIVRRTNGTRCKVLFNNDGTVTTDPL